jgi:hypothetical protein
MKKNRLDWGRTCLPFLVWKGIFILSERLQFVKFRLTFQHFIKAICKLLILGNTA